MVLQVPETVVFEYKGGVRRDLIERSDAAKNLVARVPADVNGCIFERRVYLLPGVRNLIGRGYSVIDKYHQGNRKDASRKYTHCYSQASVDAAIDPEMLAGLGADIGLTLRDRLREALEDITPQILPGCRVSVDSDFGRVYGVGAYRESVLAVINEESPAPVFSSVIDYLQERGFKPVYERHAGSNEGLVLVIYEEELDEVKFDRRRLPVESFGDTYRHVDMVFLANLLHGEAERFIGGFIQNSYKSVGHF